MAGYGVANERLRALEELEREIGAALQSAGGRGLAAPPAAAPPAPTARTRPLARRRGAPPPSPTPRCHWTAPPGRAGPLWKMGAGLSGGHAPTRPWPRPPSAPVRLRSLPVPSQSSSLPVTPSTPPVSSQSLPVPHSPSQSLPVLPSPPQSIPVSPFPLSLPPISLPVPPSASQCLPVLPSATILPPQYRPSSSQCLSVPPSAAGSDAEAFFRKRWGIRIVMGAVWEVVRSRQGSALGRSPVLLSCSWLLC